MPSWHASISLYLVVDGLMHILALWALCPSRFKQG
uniref:Uncharacterized protein n=1 Tax=Arundo donax TaxID=35708 RepID=A0A0A8ZHA4_ARUDO